MSLKQRRFSIYFLKMIGLTVCLIINQMTYAGVFKANSDRVSVSGDALFLRADYANNNYMGSLASVTGTTNTQSFVEKEFDYQFGFKIEAAKMLANAFDWHVNWYHYKATTSQNLPSNINVWGSSFTGTVVTNLTPEWDAVNLEFGKSFNPYKDMLLRLHAGGQYANIKLEQLTTGTGLTALSTQRRLNNSSYQGGGLRVGSDVSYAMPKRNLSLTLNIAGALLTGQQSFSREAVLIALPNFTSLNNGSSISTIQEVEGKIGLTKKIKRANNHFLVDIGWMWVTYFNAIQVGDQGGADGRTIVSDFSEQGLYFGAKWKGDVA